MFLSLSHHWEMRPASRVAILGASLILPNSTNIPSHPLKVDLVREKACPQQRYPQPAHQDEEGHCAAEARIP